MSYYYASRGDLLNTVILAVSLVYAGCVIRFSDLLFDNEWQRDGFCITAKDAPYWSSFDTCLYVDIIGSIILGILYAKWKNLPAMNKSSELMPFIVVGTVAHGLAHAGMAATLRKGESAATIMDTTSNDMAHMSMIHLLGIAIFFWFPLLKVALVRVDNWKVAVLTSLVMYGNLHIKPQHGFAYVQTILAMAYHGSQLLLLPANEKQHREYLMFPLLVAVPPLIVAWNEALFCSSYFKALGGHMLYDASIILCSILFYIDSYQYHTVTMQQQQQLVPDKDRKKKV